MTLEKYPDIRTSIQITGERKPLTRDFEETTFWHFLRKLHRAGLFLTKRKSELHFFEIQVKVLL